MNHIEYGYDRHVKCWCTIVFDPDNNELEASYKIDLAGCQDTIKDFKIKYTTNKVTKIKAY